MVKKLRHIINRLHLKFDKNFYPEYLRRQGVKIGKNSVILYPSYVDGRLPYLLEIGDNVIISLNATILTHDATSAYAGDIIKVGRVTIHDHCFIGVNSTIMCNVSIGPNAIIGAGSVVTENIPPNTVYAGNPAKFICPLDVFIEKHKNVAHIKHLFLSSDYPDPYIPDHKKQYLKEMLNGSFGYFCGTFPEDRPLVK